MTALAPVWPKAPSRDWPVQGETVRVHGVKNGLFLLGGYDGDEASLFGGRPDATPKAFRCPAELVEATGL